MTTQITREVRDNLRDEVAAGGLNPDLGVRVVNSRNHPEVAGRENVSRVVVGGTIAQSGISSIGIAPYIDPGNYGHEDTALVLLDVLSDPAGDDASLNTHLSAASDREAFVAQAVGNVTAHEVGHMVGSHHTDNLSETVTIMDSRRRRVRQPLRRRARRDRRHRRRPRRARHGGHLHANGGLHRSGGHAERHGLGLPGHVTRP